MAGIDNLKTRVQYRGGANQISRMVEDKLQSLKGALTASYQAAIAILEDGREFRCLINPNKISMEEDDKMLSIPFEDICLTSENIENTNVKAGSVIQWKENGTHWIVYSQYLQEIAYFRGLMRQCDSEPIEINGHRFWYYLKGPSEKGIDWQKSKNVIFNDLNYTLEIYITNNEITNQFFQRFKKCKIRGQNFEVQAVDRWSTEGILAVYLKEDYTNNWEEAPDDDSNAPESNYPNVTLIQGPARVYPYDILSYSIDGASGGTWSINNKKAQVTQQTDSMAVVEVVTGKSGNFTLSYHREGFEDISLLVEIDSL